MLAHADSSGWVDIHPRAIAEEVGLTLDQVKDVILELESPDPDSRSPEENGRRIIRMDEHRSWGWIVVNYAKYRAIRSEEDRREQNRLAQQRFREKNNQSKPRKPMSAQAEVEAEAYTEASKPKYDAQAHLLSIGVEGALIKDWFAIRRAKKLPATETAMNEILKQVELSGITPSDAIRECCSRGWAGFKASWMTKGGNYGKNGSSRADRLNNVIAELTGANRHHAPAIDGTAERVD
jgi:hypothetical protein